MSNSVFTPAILTVPAAGAGTGTGQGEINLVTDSVGAAGSNDWTSTMSSTTRDTSGSPLDPVVATGWTLSSSAANQYFTSKALSVPGGLINRKLKVEFYYNQVSGTGFQLQVGKDSGFSSKFTLTTDVSGVTAIPATAGTKGKFTAYFDADATSPIYVRLVSTGTGVMKVTQIVVGPGVQPQGAVVGEWISYMPTWGSGLTVSDNKADYRRIGDSAEIRISSKFTNTGSGGTFNLPLPSGLTLNTAAISIATSQTRVLGWGRWFDSSASKAYNVQPRLIQGGTGVELWLFTETGVVGGINGTDFGNNDLLDVFFTIPVSQWAGSGTVQLAQNDVEYAFNNDTSTTGNNASNFGYGPIGAKIQDISAALWRQVRFQSPIQSGDNLILEISSDQQKWSSAVGVLAGAGYTINTLSFDGTNSFGVGIWRDPSLASTDVKVYFGRYACGVAGSPVSWNQVKDYYWRVRKQSAGAAVGFGIVQPGVSAGLVSASGLPGNTSGNPIAGGYVGEIKEQIISSNTNYAATGNWLSIASVALTPGIWALYAQVFSQNAGATMTGIQCGITTSLNSSTGIAYNDSGAQSLPPTASVSVTQSVNGFIVNTTTSPNVTYYLNVQASYSAGQPVCQARLRAIRIA